MSPDNLPALPSAGPAVSALRRLERPLERRTVLAAGIGSALMVSPRAAGALLTSGSAPSRRHAGQADRLVESIGVNTHVAWRGTPYTHTQRIVAAINDLGLRHVRDRISPSPQARSAFMQLAEAGVRVQGMCGALGDPQTMAEVMNEVRSTYPRPERVFSAFEGINEPNNDAVPWVSETRTKIVDLAAQRDAHGLEGIRLVGPSLARVNEGGVDGETTREQSLALGDLSRVLDAGNVHVYPRTQVPSADIDKFVDYQRLVCGSLPIVCTEGGYFTAMNYQGGAWPTPEDVAAIYLPRLVLEHWSRGTKRLFLYELMDRYDPTNAVRLSSFGLLGVPHENPDAPWRKKPAYVALKNLTTIMSDPGKPHDVGGLRVHIDGPPDLRTAMFAKRNGSRYLALWRDVSCYDAGARARLRVGEQRVRLELRTPRRIAVFRPTLSARPVARLSSSTKRIRVPVAEELVIVRIR